MHIHVICGAHEAKYWLEPAVELAKKGGVRDVDNIVEGTSSSMAFR